uniref:Non-haem dioxygenase N-terminal domain-containing protein n=2 Tax=Setaria italica TaxID=4555 RepID=A0A0Q3Q921_SETIT
MAHAEVGRSIPVPNVQALAQTCSGSDEQIPERYIRVEEAAEEVISGRDISSAIPIIDLNKLLDPQSSKEECAKLGSACNQWGFFQLINHGVPDEVIHNFRNGMAEFFKQSLEAKKMYSQVPAVLKGM